MSGEEVSGAPCGTGLRPSGAEPAAQSQAEPLVPRGKFERIVWFYPGYDRTGEPGAKYGRGSMRIVFILKGDLGATQFMIGTSWGPPSSDASTHRLISSGTVDPCRPSGWDVGYHWSSPMYDGQSPQKCDLLACGECYYDGSSLRADEWVPDFVTGGDDWVWAALEREYWDFAARARGGEA